MKTKLSILCISWMCLLSACAAPQPIDCLDPEFRFSYPAKVEVAGVPARREPELSTNWALAQEMPLLGNFAYSNSLVLTDESLWLLSGNHGMLRMPLLGSGTEQPSLYLQDENISLSSVLGIDSVGLWVFGWRVQPSPKLFGTRFDAETDAFIDVVMPEVEYGEGYTISNAVYAHSKIFLVINGALYSLSVDGKSAQQEAGGLDPSLKLPTSWLEGERYLGRSIAVAGDQSIWATMRLHRDRAYAWFLVNYSSETGQIVFVTPIPLERDELNANLRLDLLVDAAGGVWLSDKLWFDGDTERPIDDHSWMRLVRPQIFIARLSHTPGGVHYLSGTPQFETREQYVWFSSEAGLARVDRLEQEWCLVSSNDVYVVGRDRNDTVWLVVDGALYTFED